MAEDFDDLKLKDETIATIASAMVWQTGKTPVEHTRRVGVL